MVNERGGLAADVQFQHAAARLAHPACIGISHDRAASALGGGLVDCHRRRGAADWCDFLCRHYASRALFAGRSKIRLGLRALIRPISPFIFDRAGKSPNCPSDMTRLF